jgi:hypothetical protein
MKSHTKKNSEVTDNRVEATPALHQTQNEADWLNSMAKIHNFRVPWAPLRSSDPPAFFPETATAATVRESSDLRGESRRPEVVIPVTPFEAVFEEIRRRNEAKTTIMEEALKRSERFQQRFWGINE